MSYVVSPEPQKRTRPTQHMIIDASGASEPPPPLSPGLSGGVRLFFFFCMHACASVHVHKHIVLRPLRTRAREHTHSRTLTGESCFVSFGMRVLFCLVVYFWRSRLDGSDKQRSVLVILTVLTSMRVDDDDNQHDSYVQRCTAVTCGD